MQRHKVFYDAALDDGGGGVTGADLEGYSGGELGDPTCTGHFEWDTKFIGDLSYLQPLELPQISSGNPIQGSMSLDGETPENAAETDFATYPYFRFHSSSLIQPTPADLIHLCNDNFYSHSTAVPVKSNNASSASVHHHDIQVDLELSTDHALGGSGVLNSHSHPYFTRGYSDLAPIPPLWDKAFDATDIRLLEFPQFHPPLARYDVAPRAHSTYISSASQGPWNYSAPCQSTSGPLVTSIGPDAHICAHLDIQNNPNWSILGQPNGPQATVMDVTTISPESRLCHASYAALPLPRMDQFPPPITEEPSFDSSLLEPPPNHAHHYQWVQPHPGNSQNLAPLHTFDSTHLGTTHQRAPLCGYTEQNPPSISQLSKRPLASIPHSSTALLGRIPRLRLDMDSPGLLNAANQYDAMCKTLSPPEGSSSTSQASNTDSSGGGLFSSSTTMGGIAPRTPTNHSPDIQNHVFFNKFSTQQNSLSRGTPSKQFRPPVLKHKDCPPNLRRYLHTDTPIPPHESDAMYEKNGDTELCIKCGYDVTPPARRSGLKYEHVNAHLDNRPYYCLSCKKGFFRKSNHTKRGHRPLWRPITHLPL